MFFFILIHHFISHFISSSFQFFILFNSSFTSVLVHFNSSFISVLVHFNSSFISVLVHFNSSFISILIPFNSSSFQFCFFFCLQAFHFIFKFKWYFYFVFVGSSSSDSSDPKWDPLVFLPLHDPCVRNCWPYFFYFYFSFSFLFLISFCTQLSNYLQFDTFLSSVSDPGTTPPTSMILSALCQYFHSPECYWAGSFWYKTDHNV